MVLVGGALAGVGALLPWLKVSAAGTSVTVSGIKDWGGQLVGLAGLAMVLRGVMAFASRSPRRSFSLLILAGVSAIAAAGVSLYDLLTYRTQTINAGVDYAVQHGASASQARSQIVAALNQGAIHLSVQIGLVMAIAGGLLGLAGVVMVFVRSRSVRGHSDPVPMAGTPAGAIASPAWTTSGPIPAAPPPPPPPPGSVGEQGDPVPPAAL